ncbi:MAG: hypothetical protein IPP22_15200 [Nitrosomonas sp.]|nr:hypothetical protein [Nitrosomonas sp.]
MIASEPQSEPFVGQARGAAMILLVTEISLIGAVASVHARHTPNPTAKVAIAATYSAQPAILDAFSPDFTFAGRGPCLPSPAG